MSLKSYRYKGLFGSHKLLIKIYIIFILLIIIPTLVLGIFYYNKMIDYTEKDLIEMNEKTLALTQNNIDDFLIRTESELWNIALNPQIMDVINYDMSFEEKILKIASIGKLIDTKIHTFDILHSINIYFDSDQKILTNETYVDIELFPDKEYIQHVFNNNTKEQHTIRLIKDESKEVKVLSLPKRIPLNSSNPKGLIVLNIDVNRLEQILDSQIHTNQIQLMMVNKNNGFSISSTNGKEELINQRITISNLVNSTGIIYRNKYMFLTYPSEYKDYIYVAAIPMSYIDGKTRPIKNTVLLMCFILLLVGGFISVVISKYLYNPIDELVTTIQKDIKRLDGGSNIHGKDELAYLKNAMIQYKSNNGYFKQVLRRNKEVIKNNVFNALFNKEYLYLDDLKANLEFLDIQFTLDNFIILAVNMDDSKVKFIDRFAVTNIAEEIILNEGINGLCVNVDQRKIAIILNLNGTLIENEKSIRQLAVKIKDMVYEYIGFTITIGVGEVVDDLCDITVSLKLALKALNYASKNTVINYYDINDEEDKIYDYSLLKVEKVINNIKVGNIETVNELFRSLIDDIRAHNALSIQNVKYMTIQLVTFIIKDLMDKGFDIKLALGEEFKLFHEIEKKETIKDIEVWVIEVFSKISNYIMAINNTQKDTIIVETFRYIEEHYSELIAVSEIAEALDITPQYLSRKFKDVKGQTLISYINDYRLKKAKELLNSTDLTVTEISAKTGFSNPKYFTKKYKKKYSITPAADRSIKRNTTKIV